MGRGGHTRSSAEGGNSRILLTEARDGLSDRKEAEAASKQKRDMLKPTGTGGRDRQGSVRRNSRAPMLLGTRRDQGGMQRDGRQGGREEGSEASVFLSGTDSERPRLETPLAHPQSQHSKRLLGPRRKEPDLGTFLMFSRATGASSTAGTPCAGRAAAVLPWEAPPEAAVNTWDSVT